MFFLSMIINVDSFVSNLRFSGKNIIFRYFIFFLVGKESQLFALNLSTSSTWHECEPFLKLI